MTPSSEQKSSGASERKRILLVEDHEDSAEMMTLFLEGEGYAVQWVSTATAALDIFQKADGAPAQQPDLILLDLTLPDIDGLEVGRRLKDSVKNAPPIIIMSAKSAHAVQSAAQSIAAAGFVRKPFATDKLMASIKTVLTPSAAPH